MTGVEKHFWKTRFSYCPKPRSEVSPKAVGGSKAKPSWLARAGKTGLAGGGFAPTAFGAYPVASALGSSFGRDPALLCEHTMEVFIRPSKPELSTLETLGTFYFGPTSSRIPSRIPELNCLFE